MHDFQADLSVILPAELCMIFPTDLCMIFLADLCMIFTPVRLSTTDGKGRNLDPANDIHTNSLDIMGLHLKPDNCNILFVHLDLHMFHLYPSVVNYKEILYKLYPDPDPFYFVLFTCSSDSRLDTTFLK
jgi:hypothetical protein